MILGEKTRILAFLLLTFWLAVNPVYTKDISEATSHNPQNEQLHEEGIVKVTLPIELVRSQAKSALLISEENPEAYVKSIDRFDMDPMQDLLIVSGVAALPASVVYDMREIAGGGDFPVEHKFNISVRFPSARKLALTRYFSLEIVEFKIDGQNYLSAFNRVSQYLVGLLVNTSFMEWVLKEGEAPTLEEKNLAAQIQHLINSKTLLFRGNNVSFKLDLSQIDALKDFAELEELRVWNISPVLIKGTNRVALQIEAGLGKPATAWFDAVKARGESEEESLEEARRSLYAEFGDKEKLSKELKEYAGLMKDQFNFPLWEERQVRFFESVENNVTSRVREGLDSKNELFKADPVAQYDFVKEETKAYIVQQLTELKVRTMSFLKMKTGGSNGAKLPFLEKRLSQDTLSQGIRFVRDFEFENEQMFPELEAVIAPHLPGVILRGVMNMDINVFMEMGLEGEGIQWSAAPWRPAQDTWGSGLPFEVALRLHSFDGGILGLDVVNFSILSGSEKTSLSKASGHGDLMATWTKMAIVETLTTMAIEDPLAVTEGEEGPVVEDNPGPYARTLSKIEEQGKIYQRELSRMFEGDLEALVKLAQIDIENNPFNSAGAQEASTKLRYLFQDIIKYDDSTEMLTFKLDPKIVSETILASENSVQVWNIEALYDSVLNQTYVELAMGDGVRSKKYIDNLFNRREYKDSQDFVGVDESRKQSESDLILAMDLQHFENFLNHIFTEAAVEQQKSVNAQLRSDVEQSHYIINDLNIDAVENGQLSMKMTATMIEKSKKGAIRRLFSNSDWDVNKKTVAVQAKLNISVEELKKYRDRIKLSPNEVFFGDELLRLDLVQAGVKFSGDTSTLDKMVNLVASDINFKGGVVKKIKTVLLNFLHKYLNDQDPKKNGNTTLGGVKLNRYAKLLAHDEEILIQLNPHMTGVAFDIRLVNNQTFNGLPAGIIVDKTKNRLEFHLSTSGNLAAVDKGELLRIMVKSRELFEPFLGDDLTAFRDNGALINLNDAVLFNSDYTKLSLLHRLKRVMKNYSGVMDIIKPDTSVVDQINRNLGTQFGVTSGEYNGRSLTASGVEIMYFLSAATLLKSQMLKFIENAKRLEVDGQVTFIGPMQAKIAEINTRIIAPLLQTYEKNFKTRNERIVKKGITDWNHTYFPDAHYCEGVYRFVKKWSEKSGSL